MKQFMNWEILSLNYKPLNRKYRLLNPKKTVVLFINKNGHDE
jgi:hypothetical protein